MIGGEEREHSEIHRSKVNTQDQEVSIGSENVAEQWEQDWLFFFQVAAAALGAGGGSLNGGLVLQIIQLNP